METFLLVGLAITVLIYGLRATRRKSIRLQEADIQKSVERVSANYVHVDRPNEEALDVWEQWYEEHFSQVEE